MAAPALTLLQIVQVAFQELGLNRPAVVANSTDLGILQAMAMVNAEIQEMQQNYDWTVLQTEYNLHVAQPVTTTGDTTRGSYQINNVASTAGILPYLFVCNAQNIPVAARVVNVTSGSVLLSEPATGNTTGAPCVFAKDTYPEPQDFSRFINQTWWDRTNRWSLMGPDSPQVDQWHRSGVVTIGPRRHFRQVGPQIPTNYIPGAFNNDFNADFLIGSQGGANQNYRLWPPPGALDTPIDLVFEYISNSVVISPTLGVGQTVFIADTDYPILNSRALVLGAKWRIWQQKGFDYAPLQSEAIDFVERLFAVDGGNKTLSLSPMRANYLITSSNVQDGFFPGPTGPNSS